MMLPDSDDNRVRNDCHSYEIILYSQIGGQQIPKDSGGNIDITCYQTVVQI